MDILLANMQDELNQAEGAVRRLKDNKDEMVDQMGEARKAYQDWYNPWQNQGQIHIIEVENMENDWIKHYDCDYPDGDDDQPH